MPYANTVGLNVSFLKNVECGPEGTVRRDKLYQHAEEMWGEIHFGESSQIYLRFLYINGLV